MKKNYSAPAITVYDVETASMLMGSTEVYQNDVSGFDGNSINSMVITGEVDTGTDGEGLDAGGAW